MKKKLFVPMSIDGGGSSGSLFDDSILLKLIGCLAGSVILAIVGGRLAIYVVSPGISIIVAIIILFVVMSRSVRIFAFKEDTLNDMYIRMTKFKITDVGDFSDITPHVDNGIFFHNNGQISMFVEVVRGSTIHADSEELEEYRNALVDFQNELLGYRYSISNYNIEIKKVNMNTLTKQRVKALKKGNKTLINNLTCRNVYIKSFMDKCVRDERDIYVINATYGDLKMFNLRVKKCFGTLNSTLIKEKNIFKTLEDVREFGEEYFDVDVFNIENNDTYGMDSIMKNVTEEHI